jgi:3-oxoacyl-[acyl-carrier protein] reductase
VKSAPNHRDFTGAPGVALVTGGSRGIGRAFVLEAARRGYTPVFSYQTRARDAEETVAMVAALGCRAAAVQAELSDFAAVGKVAAEARAAGPVALLVNNAGIGEDVRLGDLTQEVWERYLAINLTAPCFLVKLLKDDLAMARGCVLNVSSDGGVVGSLHGAPYGATKAGLIGLTRTLARELAPDVRVNAIAPGPVSTEMWDGIPEDQKQLVYATTPLRRVAEPDEIARAGLDICQWPNVTGEVLVIDGGRVMG